MIVFSTYFREHRGGYVRMVRFTLETRRHMHDVEFDANGIDRSYVDSQPMDPSHRPRQELTDAVRECRSLALEYLKLADSDPVLSNVFWWRVKEAVDRFNKEEGF